MTVTVRHEGPITLICHYDPENGDHEPDCPCPTCEARNRNYWAAVERGVNSRKRREVK